MKPSRFIKCDDWHGCYSKNGWLGGVLTEASFSHPAKVSFFLAERIYQHTKEEGWLAEGQTVVDCFAGIGGFAFHALQHGLNFVGCELEPRFVALAEQNIALWNRKYGRMPRWGTARIVQGDSRRLAEVVGGGVGATISSPPYAAQMNEGGDTPCARGIGRNTRKQRPCEAEGKHNLTRTYGDTPGQLAKMGSGDVRVDLGIGNLAAMDAAISSPPYEGTHVADGEAAKLLASGNGRKIPDGAKDGGVRYGDGDMGQGETFWGASRTIMEQVHAILRPGGHAIWVLKRFVKGGKIVEFSKQWAALCESVGFRAVCWHRAWLVEDHGVQGALVGDEKYHRIERKSFFRRLAEKKGSPREAHRMKDSRDSWIVNRYPLVDMKMSRDDCVRWLKTNGFFVPQKSACIGCSFHSNSFWKEQMKNRPDEFKDAEDFDRELRERPYPGVTGKVYIHRKMLPLREAVESTMGDRNQGDLFGEECDGVCGV